jgi:drug/metabolite transporter (DMT)-like permease
MRRAINLGGLSVCLAAIMWGFDGVVLTPRLYNLQIDYVVFVLHALPFILMNIFLYREYRVLRELEPTDFLYLFLIALFGGALGTLAIVKALFLVQFKQLTVVALLQKLQPVFAVVLAGVLLRERIGRGFALWAGVAVVGSYFLTFELHSPALAGDGNMLPAAFYSLIAAFSFGSSTVFGKRVLGKLSFRAALLFRYGLTALIMAVILGINGHPVEQFVATSGFNWGMFVLIGLTTGSGAIMLYYFGLKRIRASDSTILELSFPISTIVFDYVFNGNVLSPIQAVAAAVMIYAIYRIGTSGGGSAESPASEAVGEPSGYTAAD